MNQGVLLGWFSKCVLAAANDLGDILGGDRQNVLVSESTDLFTPSVVGVVLSTPDQTRNARFRSSFAGSPFASSCGLGGPFG